MEGTLLLVAGVVGIGFLHGVLPDHGWPIAAAYALGRPNRWLAGLVAGLVIGVGHLLSSIALVVVFFWVRGTYDLVGSDLLRYASGSVLVLLGVYEYASGHGHDHGDGAGFGHSHSHGRGHEERSGSGDSHHRLDHGHGDSHEHDDGHGSEHAHESAHRGSTGHDPAYDGSDGEGSERGRRSGTGVVAGVRDALTTDRRSLWNLGVIALALGVAHEEPIQIIAICAGTAYCLELMFVYSIAVVVAILAPTLLLVAGYERHRDRVERVEPHLSTVTAAVLVGMGLAFVLGLV